MRLVHLVSVICSVLALTLQAAGQEILFQNSHLPGNPLTSTNYVLANQLQSHPNPYDEGRTRAWDSFQLASDSALTGLRWSGAFDGPFKPDALRPELDFWIEIFRDTDSLAPWLDAPLFSWLLDSGTAGSDDGLDVRSQERPDELAIRGGSVFDYSTTVEPARLTAGNYWISITAVQTFPNPSPIEDPVNGFWDPGWGWHYGTGDGGSWIFDGFRDAAEPGRRFSSDLSFALLGTVEPDAMIGDFDGSGVVDVVDLDLLDAAIRSGEADSGFDANGDGLVNLSDQVFLVQEILGTRAGDADLNLRVDFNDFLALSGNFNEPGTWRTGDFDASGTTAFSDFLLLSSNFGFETESGSVLSTVPEAVSLAPFVLSVLLVMGHCRLRRKSSPCNS